MHQRAASTLLSLAMATALGACGVLARPEQGLTPPTVEQLASTYTPDASLQRQPTTPPLTPTADLSPTPTVRPTSHRPLASREITLTLWLPPEMAPDLDTERPETGAFIAGAHEAFVAAHPAVHLQVIPKAPYGNGGMTDLLLAMEPVLPARLPDVAAIDTAELGALVSRGIVSPLDDLIAPALWDDLFPFALEAATFDNALYAFPFQADILFAAYNSGILETPPRTWDDLAAAKATYIVPAAQGDGSAADAFLIQYVARGGSVEQRPLTLDSTIAAKVLRDYRTALEIGVIPQQVRDLQTLDECWGVYLSGAATMSITGSWHYLRDQGLLKRTRYATIPNPTGQVVTLARSWSWIITTKDPDRRQAAAQYVAAMVDAKYLGQWGLLSYHLPTRRSGLSAIEDAEFGAFLEGQLVHASPYPASPLYPKAQAALARSIEDVLDGITTPERAAISVAASISRLNQ